MAACRRPGGGRIARLIPALPFTAEQADDEISEFDSYHGGRSSSPGAALGLGAEPS